MLVLTRREGEWLELRVPNRETAIRICLTKLRLSGASIGIEADDDIKILRGELDGDPANPVCSGVGLATAESE